MQVLAFHLMGKMAHFRKYYSNSTALSYYLPPVVTVKGILAGLLGKERDSYYTEFSDDMCKIAVGIGAKTRKITQAMNLLKVEKPDDLNGSSRPNGKKYRDYGANHTQNDTEWIIPENFQMGALCYPVRFWHRNSDLMDELAEKLCSFPGAYGSEGISLALGSAQCLGWIDGAKLLETEKIESNCLKTRFAAPISAVKGLDRTVSLRNISLLKEETMVEFDANRTITEKSRQNILISDNGTSICFQLNPQVPFWRDEEDDYLFLGGPF